MASAVGDQIILEKSGQREYPDSFVRNSIWEFVEDTNATGMYTSGMSTIDSSTLANSNKWIDYRTAYLTIPFRIRMTAATDAADIGIFAAGIKNGFYHMIDSAEISINGVEIQQTTSLSNIMWGFRLMTTLSVDDATKIGEHIGFFPDSSSSWSYRTAAGAAGLGPCNNTDASALGVSSELAAQTPNTSNNGYYKRQLLLSYNAATGTQHEAAATTASLSEFFKANCEYTAATAGSPGQCIWNAMAIVRLKDICPLFGQISLTKGLLIRITMHLNQPSFTITGANTGAGPPASGTLSVGAVSFPYNGFTNPVMVSDSSSRSGGNSLIVTDSNYDVDLRVGTTPFSSDLLNGSRTNYGPFSQTAIRLWVNTLVLTPQQESTLIADPVRRYAYNDIYQNSFTLQGQASTNQNLFQSVPRVRRLLMVPLDATYGLTSPFDSEPATTMPLAAISQFQVAISGVNRFPTEITYDYRMWLEEVSKTGLYSNMVTGLSSGLIGYEDWSMNQRFYLVNLHTGAESEDAVGKNISVSFKSNSDSGRTLRWVCFCEYERHLTLNIVSGAVVEFE